MTFIDLRDRYGITQLTFNESENKDLCKKARTIGREWVISIDGIVKERSNKNKKPNFSYQLVGEQPYPNTKTQ